MVWGKLRNLGKGGVKDDLEDFCFNVGLFGIFRSLDDVFFI